MKPNKSKILIVLVLVILLFSFLSSFVLAERQLEVDYPEVGGEEITLETTLPEYVEYIFNFSLIIAAVIAFAVLIYGGFRYLTSAGSPEAMRDAKSWLFGGVLGLIVLLCSYLILVTINPELVGPREEPIEPITGIYLINADDEKFYIPESQNKISFDAVSLEFISPETELISVFISPEEEFDEENSTEIINQGTGSTASVSNVRSIYFLWLRPGVYLYANESFGTPPPPRLYQSSSENLRDFSDEEGAKSMKFLNEPGSISLYIAILFEHVDFKGKCSSSFGNDTASFPDRVRNEVSSMAIFKTAELHGEIIFYDDQNCQGNSYTFEPAPGYIVASYELTLADTGLDKWLSFMISGNMSILINTEEDLSGRCQLFAGAECHASLKGTSVYSSWPGGFRPKRASIYPTEE